MDDLRRRFASLDAVVVPDLQAEIERRAAARAKRRVDRVAPPRPLWRPSAATRGASWRPRFDGVSALVVLALVLAAFLGLLVIGAGLWFRSTVVIAPSQATPSATSMLATSPPEATPSPSSSLRLVFYLGESAIWAASADGSGAHELVPGGRALQLSADGRLLAFWVNDELSVAEVAGPEPRLTIIRDVRFPAGFAFSPDASKLGFLQSSADPDQSGTIAIMDRSTGTVTELASTAVHGLDGRNRLPKWSPDGSQLVFDRAVIGPVTAEDPFYDRTIYVVNADGSGLRQLVPTELSAGDASWSPDGSRILFTSAIESLGLSPQTGKRDLSLRESDVYSVRPDGTDLRRLTVDTFPPMERGVPIDWGATAVSWTREGRIIFTRVPRDYFSNFSNGTPEVVSKLWVMDADGGNQQPLDQTDLGQLTAAGCVVCPYPPNTGLWIVDPLAYWEPGP